MVNKISPGGRGGGQKKFKKGINIFSKKGFLRGGYIVPPPKQKPSYAPVKVALIKAFFMKQFFKSFKIHDL